MRRADDMYIPSTDSGFRRHTHAVPASSNGSSRRERVLITGGAGFVGTNVAHRLLQQRRHVVLYDNLSRPGVQNNVRWLREQHGDRVELVQADVRDGEKLRHLVNGATMVFHFAAQVAVTTSLMNPLDDFEVNARGTINLLEAIRTSAKRPPLLFTSTNKVFGNLPDLALVPDKKRYQPEDEKLRRTGIPEAHLNFHSPYGCSKGAADQYVLDYARSFGLPATVFRMSCIYGPHQCGNEDQGWVAHFIRSALEYKAITLYGDGRQVRDVLFVDDLVDAMLLAVRQIDQTRGQAFNIGGGPDNTVSLLELMDLITQIHGQRPEIRFDEWRTGDQKYYVSDIRKFRRATGWSPAVDVREGVERLYRWLHDNLATPPAQLAAKVPAHK